MTDATPELMRAPLIKTRNYYFDSEGWADYQPRADDVIIATYPKCGTTWTQRIVGMLIFQSADPFPVQDSSPWPDFRLPPPGVMLELAESQTHRRFLKSHLPYDALPLFEGVKVIHVARDGRDAAMSFHNHKLNYTNETLARLDEIVGEDPKFQSTYPRVGPDPAEHFCAWLTGEADYMGDEKCGYFHVENSYWAARHEPNLLMVHFADMKADLEGEMRRIADFLDIEVADELWPDLVEAATFSAMKARATDLMPNAGNIWKGGGKTFLNKGTNDRWRTVYDPDDLKTYDEKVAEQCSDALANWLESGRLGAGNPRELAD